jgi:hypothetical protein
MRHRARCDLRRSGATGRDLRRGGALRRSGTLRRVLRRSGTLWRRPCRCGLGRGRFRSRLVFRLFLCARAERHRSREQQGKDCREAPRAFSHDPSSTHTPESARPLSSRAVRQLIKRLRVRNPAVARCGCDAK